MDTDQPTTAPSVDQSVAAAVATATGDVNWHERYQAEVQDRIKERNLYKPYMQAFKHLDETDRQALLGLADAVARQDYQTIVEWSLATAENVAGRPITDVIAERQQQAGLAQGSDITSSPQTSPPADQTGYMNPDELIARAAEVARLEAQATFRTQQFVQEYTRTLTDAGFESGSPEAQAVIQLTRAFNGDMGRAIQVFRAEQSLQQQGLVAAAAAAGQTPAPAPTGAPQTSVPSDLSPRERMMNRLMSSPTR